MGREQHVDWASSWRLQQVGDREWEELKGRIRREYAGLIETLEGLPTWGEQQWVTAWRSSRTRPITLVRFGTHSRILGKDDEDS